ncbi:hypothetical protein S7711_01456 [Stachybotrys chartarum IBT 7711]|uniref:Aminoglycoside phosphotransferase domain-containing protein n=1 Tax=Stachybotrys chartarum (strain CBS 109288 / IBT 7711) TaxID=1280523 RepID=A0A084B713_STACB|nr:hypothetical protein S7711_01456 [Stachybotrys chartarum IBT 7711]
MIPFIETLLPLRLRLWLGSLVFRTLGPTTVRVSWHRVIKGPCEPPEVEAMQYVASHTTVPVPTVYAVHTQKNGCIYIEMAYVPGQCLDSLWSSLSTGQRDQVVADIKQHLSELRKLEPPAQSMVCSALQNPAHDYRIGARFFGPLNHDEFHSLARGHLRMEDVAPFLGEEVAKVHTTRYRTCFTHADLVPRNILIEGGRVAAIIDWGLAGWYPEYWEFTKAHYSHLFDQDWEDCLRLALPSYEVELLAEGILWEKLPEPGTLTISCHDGVWSERKGSDPSASWLESRKGRQSTDLWSLALSKEQRHQ